MVIPPDGDEHRPQREKFLQDPYTVTCAFTTWFRDAGGTEHDLDPIEEDSFVARWCTVQRFAFLREVFKSWSKTFTFEQFSLSSNLVSLALRTRFRDMSSLGPKLELEAIFIAQWGEIAATHVSKGA
jgi:hypothetical protein